MAKTITTTTDKVLTFKGMNGADYELKDCVGKQMNLAGVIQFEKEEKDETKTITILVDEENKTYSTISPTISDSVHRLCEVFCEYDSENDKYAFVQPVPVVVIEKMSKNKRNFLSLDVRL